MKYIIIPMLFCFVSCGGAYTLQVSGQVNVVASIDPSSIEAAFQQACQSQLGPNATQDQINTCVSNDVTNLINGLSNLMNK